MKQKLLLILILIASIVPLPTLARDFTYTYEGQTLTYTVLDEEAKTCETKQGEFYSSPGNNVSGELVIPSTVTDDAGNAYTVTSIGDYAFYRCSGLTGSLTIPNSVTSIGDDAFVGCSGFTGSLNISESVTTIGGSAFYGCSGFTSVTIPNSVTSIGHFAFNGCSGLKAVYYIDSLEAWCNIDFGGSYANPTQSAHNLYLNGELLTNLVIPDSITKIKPYIFSGCSCLTGDLTIPNSVTSIGNYAFEGCSGFTGDLTIPNSVTSIGNYAFEGCSGFTGDLTIPNSVTSIGNSVFNGCRGFTGTLILPETITEIGNYAFYNCNSIDSIICNATIPPHIGNNAFYKVYDSVLVLTVPNGCVQTYRNADGWSRFNKITDISGDEVSILQSYTSDNLYYTLNNSDLTATVYAADVKNTSSSEIVTIPASIEVDGKEYTVTTVGEYAFYNSSMQINPVLPKSIRAIKEEAFAGPNTLKGDLILPDSLTYIGKRAFYMCTNLTGDLVIPQSVAEIGDSAFYLCTNITGNLVFPKSVKSIGRYAFYRGKYTSLNILNPDIEMGSHTFYYCSSLDEVTLPEGLTQLPDQVFSACSSLKQIQLPQSLTSIGKSALSITGIESIVIPESVSEIGENAFGGNHSLESITLPSKLKKIEYGLFYYCPKLMEITIPENLDSIGEYAFKGDTALVKVNVESLEQWSKINFANETANPLCYGAELVINGKSAEVIEVPEEVTEVKDYAFAGLKTIVEVVIPEVVEAIGTGSFTGCSGLENIKIPEAVKSIGEKAFKACTGLTSAIIGKIIAPSRAAESETSGELATVQSCAFDSCTNLANVAIGANVAMIADSAFINCDKISRVDCYAMLAPEVASTAFEQEVQSSAALHVPAGYKDVYEASPVWSKFTTIFDDLAVAERLTMDTESVEINESATRQLSLRTTVNGTVTWTSSDENVATVNTNGVVTGINAGTAQITATAPNGARAICTVTVVKPAAIDGVDSDLQDAVRVEGNSIIAPEGSVVYDLNGRRVKATNLAKGIYIVRLGSKAVKVRL